MLLKTLIEDDKKNFYSTNQGWKYKVNTTISELNKKGLQNFRGLDSGISTSFGDNLVSDVRNEYNGILKNFSKIFSLPGFRNIFNSQLRLTNSYIHEYLKNLQIIYSNNHNVLNLIQKYNFQDSVNFDCKFKFDYLNKSYSILYLEMANKVEKLNKYFEFLKINSYMEIGGGFGANIHFLVNNFPNIKKIIYLDVVPNLYVGTEYLKLHFKDKVKDYLSVKNSSKIEFSKNDDLEIICIPPWEIQKIKSEIDHFHNSNSFVEMPQETIKDYYQQIKRLRIKQISIISYEKSPSMETQPEKINEILGNKLKVFFERTVIEELKIKDMYLISNKFF